MITGDFKIHFDNSHDPDANRLLDLFESMGLRQHVDESTHEHGHTLDLMITRASDSIIWGSPVIDHLFLDHSSVITTLQMVKTEITSKERVCRKINSIDLDSFFEDLTASELCQNTPRVLDELVNCYNNTLGAILDKHAPPQRKIIATRPRVPWYNDDILAAKRIRRKTERKWRRTKSLDDLIRYKSARNFATDLTRKARFDFYLGFIQENSGNPRKLFEASKQLLNHQSDVPFPPHKNRSMLANEMGNFFVQKISNIRSKFKECTIRDCKTCQPSENSHLCSSSFNCFEPLTQNEVYNVIMGMAKKSCALDQFRHLYL